MVSIGGQSDASRASAISLEPNFLIIVRTVQIAIKIPRYTGWQPLTGLIFESEFDFDHRVSVFQVPLTEVVANRSAAKHHKAPVFFRNDDKTDTLRRTPDNTLGVFGDRFGLASVQA